MICETILLTTAPWQTYYFSWPNMVALVFTRIYEIRKHVRQIKKYTRCTESPVIFQLIFNSLWDENIFYCLLSRCYILSLWVVTFTNWQLTDISIGLYLTYQVGGGGSLQKSIIWVICKTWYIIKDYGNMLRDYLALYKHYIEVNVPQSHIHSSSLLNWAQFVNIYTDYSLTLPTRPRNQ